MSSADLVADEEDFIVHINKDSARLRRSGGQDLPRFSDSFACWGEEDGARAFDQSTVERFLQSLHKEGFISAVIGFNEFPYSRNNTLVGGEREVEREYWFEVDSDDSGLSGPHGMVIVHVHYAGKWSRSSAQRDRSTITQINIRHTATCQEQAFHKKCQDLGKWRERFGKPLFKGVWKWQEEQERQPELYRLLSLAEECNYFVRGRNSVQSSVVRKPRALVIAISNYGRIPSLANALEDGLNLYKVLNRMGWTGPPPQTDLGYRDMMDAIHGFLKDEQDFDRCIFAFIGHGIGVNGNHYLVPKDASLELAAKNATDFESFVKPQCIALDWVQQEFARKRRGGNPTALLLDCCRNCDYKTVKQGSADDGLLPEGRISSPPAPKTNLKNSCVVYSTTEGLTAKDGIPGAGGPFMNAFTMEIQLGGSLGDIVRRTRTRLEGTPGNWQLAPMEDKLLGEQGFHFAPLSPQEKIQAVPASAAGAASGASVPQQPSMESLTDALLQSTHPEAGTALSPLPFVLVNAVEKLASEDKNELVNGWEGYEKDGHTGGILLESGWNSDDDNGCGEQIIQLKPSILHFEAHADEKDNCMVFKDKRVSYGMLQKVLKCIQEDEGSVRLLVLMVSGSARPEIAALLRPYADCIVALRGKPSQQSRNMAKKLYKLLRKGKTFQYAWDRISASHDDDLQLVQSDKLVFSVCPKPLLDLKAMHHGNRLNESDLSGADTPDAGTDAEDEVCDRAALFLYNPQGNLASYANDVLGLFECVTGGNRQPRMSMCTLLIFVIVKDSDLIGFQLGSSADLWESWKRKYIEAAARGQQEEVVMFEIFDMFEDVAARSGAGGIRNRLWLEEARVEHSAD